MAFDIDNLISTVTSGQDTSSREAVSVSQGTAATAKSKSGSRI